MEQKKDRIGQYLVPHLSDYVFDELSNGYLERAGVADIMSGVPVPINKRDLNSGITVLKLALAMAFVIGCDPEFEYRDNYIQYILRNFDKRFADGLIAQGVEGAEKHDYDYACIQFRAALQIDSENGNAYYCYGRSCKDAYEKGEEEEFIGRFKAEAMEAFEVATIKSPSLTDAYYYLGYCYLNMGLYIKAKLTWETFVELLKSDMDDNWKKDKQENNSENNCDTLASNGAILRSREENEALLSEIEERINQLSEPVKIEEGYNMILSEKYEEGIHALEPYTEGKYKTWWPLWYYLGIANHEIGKTLVSEDKFAGVEHSEASASVLEKAKSCYLEVLKLSPSNEDAMEKLAEVYKILGDDEKTEKYTKKIKIIRANREEDKKLRDEQGELAGTPDPEFDERLLRAGKPSKLC